MNNAQSPDLKTYLCGQICRALVIFKVDEVVVFQQESGGLVENDTFTPSADRQHFDAQSFMVHIMRYLDCPQYLRRLLFPHHPNLKFAGLLNPIDAPHHLRKGEVCQYRDGVVTAMHKQNCSVECGFDTPLEVPLSLELSEHLQQGMRVTLRFDDPETITRQNSTMHSATVKKQRGKKGSGGQVCIVPPRQPSFEGGLYWGYNVREASSFSNIFKECPFEGGYDLTIGTSERGHSIDSDIVQEQLMARNPSNAQATEPFRHLLVVFGGLQGIEACVEGDSDLMQNTKINPSENCADLFDFWLNTCTSQGSRTIRSEEAILITMTALKPYI